MMAKMCFRQCLFSNSHSIWSASAVGVPVQAAFARTLPRTRQPASAETFVASDLTQWLMADDGTRRMGACRCSSFIKHGEARSGSSLLISDASRGRESIYEMDPSQMVSGR